MSIFSNFKTNKEKETKGVPIEYPANEDGSIPTFFVTRMSRSNKKYTKSLEAKTKPVRRQIELGVIKHETAEKINVEVFVDSILTGWENIKREDGTVVTFSKKNAIDLFEELPDLFDDLSEQAKSAASFQDEIKEEEAKN